jgi:DNA-binding response OmpR family regulator
MSIRLLMVDPEHHSNLALREYFSKVKVETFVATSRAEAWLKLRQISPNFILVDAELPRREGFELCREIRESSRVPIILLSNQTDITDKILGFKLGADDYLAKPVDPRELLARMESILRRLEETPTRKILKYDGLEIDLQTGAVNLDDKPVILSTMEFAVLRLFAEHPGKVLKREDLMLQLSGSDAGKLSRSVDVLVSRLRQKLHDNQKQPRFFRTIWGTGYIFIAAQKS